MKFLTTLVALAALSLMGCGAKAATLAEDGRALMPIVIAADAGPAVRAAADDLAHYLGQISGATFEIKTDDDGAAGIVLGTLVQFPDAADPSISKALAMNGPFDGREAFIVRTSRDRVLLLGAAELGASHAAYRLLHQLGCRWYMPAAAWEVVPQRAQLEVELNVDDRPAYLARRIWYGYGFFDRNERRCADEYAAWTRRNAMAMSLRTYCGHAWDTIIAENKAVFDEHPEYFAMKDGERNPKSHKFCISNADLRKLVADYAAGYFDKRPDSDMVSLDPSDGGGHCECEPCAAIGGVSDRVFMLANEGARAVAAAHPGKMVGLYAYNLHSEPPTFTLEPNVYVQLTAGFTRGQYTFDELVEQWPKKASSMGFYEYFSVYLWDWDMPPGGRGANIGYITKAVRRYAKAGATSLDCESGDNWGLHGRGYYLANRLMWNPDADPQAILDDFHRGAFGPAAQVMQRYYDRLDPGNDPLMSEHLIALALRDLDEAATLAADHPDVLARLDQLKTYMRYVHLRWLIERTADKDEKKTLTLAALTHVYRSRYTYMNHWEAMRQSWTPKAAKEFEEPSWSFRYTEGPQPWRVDEPYTRDEIDAFFREGLERFKPQPFDEITYSNDLLPVVFEGYKPAKTLQKYQNAMPLVMYSLAGEPLRISVVTGTIAWYRDRANARYKWLDAAGNELASGKLPLDGEEHDITLDPPRGLYSLDFNDSGEGWRFTADEDQILSITPRRAGRYHHAGWMQPIWFYVPKGTKQIVYFWAGNNHRVHGPDGQIVKKVDTNGAFVTVAVPDGADGKPWHFSQIALGNLRFFNVPNVFAASPQALLVPREVIEADGLVVRE